MPTTEELTKKKLQLEIEKLEREKRDRIRREREAEERNNPKQGWQEKWERWKDDSGPGMGIPD